MNKIEGLILKISCSSWLSRLILYKKGIME